MTNADRIRRMTDEDIAMKISENIDCDYCPLYVSEYMNNRGCVGEHLSCFLNILDWLKEESGE